MFDETVPVETADGKHLVCEACGSEVYENEKYCGHCKREINWDK